MWNDLVTTALLGTERRALKLDDADAPLHALASSLENDDAERALLALAGAMAVYRRAGQTPGSDTSPPLDPCDLDDLPPCSPRAGLILQQILGLSAYSIHLDEWVALAARAGQRVAEEFLPRLFLSFERRSVLPDGFYDVLGQRGRWLARQNPAWAFALLPESNLDWETASFPARLDYLRRRRATDPARARTLVESIWNSERADRRVSMMITLETGLSLADEPFLETLLDGDLANRLHYHAEWLLANLPASAYRQRMAARAATLIRIGWQDTRLVIDVQQPNTWDESMGRDGIEREPPGESPLDMPTNWLLGIAQRLSSSYWLGGNWSARELVKAASENLAWKKLLLGAMAKMTEREKHDTLANALLEEVLDPGDEQLALSGAQAETREAFVLRALERERTTPADGIDVFKLLGRLCELEDHWSSPLTHAIIATTTRTLAQKSAAEVNTIAHRLPDFARKMSPACLPQLQALASVENKNNYVWAQNVKRAVETLEFRRNMRREFAR